MLAERPAGQGLFQQLVIQSDGQLQARVWKARGESSPSLKTSPQSVARSNLARGDGRAQRVVTAHTRTVPQVSISDLTGCVPVP